MSNICKSCGLPVWNDTQLCDACSSEVKHQIDEKNKFNRKEKNYQAIRWTNVTLFWIFYLLEAAVSAIRISFPSLLTVLIG